MIGLKRAAPLAVMWLLPFTAQADTTYVFSTVTGIQYGSTAYITGVLAGQSTPSTVQFPLAADGFSARCENWLDLMISNPAVFTVTLTTHTITDPVIGPVESFGSCTLNRLY